MGRVLASASLAGRLVNRPTSAALRMTTLGTPHALRKAQRRGDHQVRAGEQPFLFLAHRVGVRAEAAVMVHAIVDRETAAQALRHRCPEGLLDDRDGLFDVEVPEEQRETRGQLARDLFAGRLRVDVGRMWLRAVVFPEPLGPLTRVSEPSAMFRLRSSTAATAVRPPPR